MLIPFGEWAPDQPILGSSTASIAKNCIPLTKGSYGPLNSLSYITSALTAKCQGAIAVRASDGNVYFFAGDATKLYMLSGTTWTDVSKGGGYTTAVDGFWNFVQIGDRVVATNYADAIQTFIVGTSSVFADLSSGAPKAKYLDVVKGALMVANTYDTTDGARPNRVWWPDLLDPTNWPVPGTAAAQAAQSDFNDIFFGGGIYGIAGGVGGRHGVVWLENAIVPLTFTGPGAVFSFDDGERGRGTTIPGSIVSAGEFAGYIGETGFNLFNGSSSVPIGTEKVDRWFWDLVDQENLNLIRASVNLKYKLILWGFSSGGTVCDYLAIYNWALGQWSYAQVDTELILKGYTGGFDLDTTASAITGDADLDSSAPGLDSTAFMGGRILAAGFDSSHRFGYFNGDTLEATFETCDVLDPDGRLTYCTGLLPVGDAATVTAAVGYRLTPSATVAYTTPTSPANDRFCPQRKEAAYMRAQVIVAAAQTWTEMQGVIPRINRGSQR